MRTHGGGRACYYGYRPESGTCEQCRRTHARQQTNYNRSPAALAAARRYQMTAKGMLTSVRHNAKERAG